jgi:predicted PurR-regulated permease PerM
MTNSTSELPPQTIERMIVDVVIRLAFLGILVYWAGLIVSPFVTIVIWAAILAVAVSPLYEWLKRKVGGRGSIASLVITLTALSIILGPTAILVSSAGEFAQELSTRLEAGTLSIPAPAESVREWPLIGEKVFAVWTDASTNQNAFLKQHSEEVKKIFGGLLSAAAGLGGGVLSFAASVIIAGFLYGGGKSMAGPLADFAVRIVGERGREFVTMSAATVRNVAQGVVGISFGQALFLGVGMMVAGVPAAGLLTFVILILCIIQIGPTLIVLPTIIWAWSNMDTVGALVFTVFMLIGNFGDSAIKPVVMAKGLKTPMLVIFIGVIGGTFAHGLIGLFLGPIVLAILYDLLIVWTAAFRGTANPPLSE